MDPGESSDTTFSGSTAVIAKALLDAPVMRSWPPTLEEALKILTGQPYEVLERIGHGGMGAVFKVSNLEPGIGRVEAVKIRRPEARDDDVFRERFLREIGTLAQLRHPGITTVYRSGDSAEGYLWFSMEFLEGQSLDELLTAGQRALSPERVLDITRQLCVTLQFVHKAGRLHRDLKPANVMICEDGSVRLLDFGIARPMETSTRGILTRPGENPHTPDYASPEQRIGGPVDERADLYGLGRILNEMIRPADGSARERRPRFSQRLLDLVDDLLAFDCNDRPRSAAEVAVTLDQMEPGAIGFWGKDRSPFRGLEAYQPEHAEIFFGRNDAIRRGEEIVRTASPSWHGFCLIIGGSGSGKSSLARAGLGPELLRGEKSAGEENANIAPVICDLSAIRPEDECLLPPLARCLAAAIGTDPLALADALRHSGADLTPLLAISSAGAPAVRLCLILDQFEHFFRHSLPRSAQTRFLIAISRLTRTPGVAVLVTLRSDFYHHCGAHPVLMELKEGHQLDLAAPQPWELAAMLRLSARAASLSFETLSDGRGLDDVLLDHAHQNPQTLPLMSYILEQLWERRDKENGLLRLSEYEQLGGFEGSVAAKATETFDRFSEDYPQTPNACLDKLFHLVVEMSVSSSTPALVRRLATAEELAATDPDVRRLAERFVAARLFVTTCGADGSNRSLTLAHECLLRVWPRATTWAEHNRELLRVRSRIDARMKEGSPLLEGDPFLEVAKEHLTRNSETFTPDQARYVRDAAALAEEQCRRLIRRRRRVITVLSLLTILALAGGFVAWQAAALATKQRSIAEGQRTRAETQRVQAEAATAKTRRTLSQSHFLQAVHSIDTGCHSDALAHLARSLYYNHQNEASVARSVTLLTNYDFPLPVFRFDHDLKVWMARYSPNGKLIVTASFDRTARIWDAGTGEPVTSPLRHSDFVLSAEFSMDSTRIVTCSKDQTAQVWDARSGNPIGEPMKHGDEVRTASFSPDGTRVVTASWDHTARIWDAMTGNAISDPMQHDDMVWMAQFSSDGNRIVTASEDATARVWDGRTGLPVTGPLKHGGRVQTAQFSPNGKSVVSASQDSTARVWETETGRPLIPPFCHANSASWKTEIWSAEFSPDGRSVVTASWDKTARIWNTETGEPLTAPLQHSDFVMSARFSPDGERLVIATLADGTARIWDSQTGEPLSAPMRHFNLIRWAQFSPDGKSVVTASEDYTARVWNVAPSRAQAAPIQSDGLVTSAAFSPNGERIVTSSLDGGLRVWNAQSGELLLGPMISKSSDEPFELARFDPDGKRILALSRQGTVSVWDAFSGKIVIDQIGQFGIPRACQFSPDGIHFLTRTSPTAVQLWSSDSGKPYGKPMEHPEGEILFAEFSPDGKKIVTGAGDNTARVWAIPTCEQVGQPMTHRYPVFSARFSPDGKRIVTSADETARVWDAETGLAISNEMNHRNFVWTACFSPDGTRVATATFGVGIAQIWDAESGWALTQPMKHNDFVNSVEFSPDGKQIATASKDGSVRVWDVETGQPLAEPMLHKSAVSSASYSVDGRRLLTVADGSAKVWDLWPCGEAPEWLSRLVDAVAGEKLDDRGVITAPSGNSAVELRDLKKKLDSESRDNPWVVWGRWYLADRSTRTISPFSKITPIPDQKPGATLKDARH